MDDPLWILEKFNIHLVWLLNIYQNRKNVIYTWKMKIGIYSYIKSVILILNRLDRAKYKKLKIHFEAMDRLTAESGTGLKEKGRVWTD